MTASNPSAVELHQSVIAAMRATSPGEAMEAWAAQVAAWMPESKVAFFSKLPDHRHWLHLVGARPVVAEQWIQSLGELGRVIDPATLRCFQNPLDADAEPFALPAAWPFTGSAEADPTAVLWVTPPADPELHDSYRTLADGIAACWQLIVETWIRVESESGQDPVTGLRSRSAWAREFSLECERARRHNVPICLILIDIDGFKSVNDQFGHPEGDRVLRHLGLCLNQLCRITDGIYRYGGDEIAILLSHTSQAGGVAFLNRLQARLQDPVDPPPYPISISAGVSAWSPPDDPRKLTKLLQNADRNLYLAKQQEAAAPTP